MIHQLENKELVNDILKWLDDDDHLMFKQFIDNQEYELAEQICRHYHEIISETNYILTAGKACSYWDNGKIDEEYTINSNGQKDGEYMRHEVYYPTYGSAIKAEYKLYQNGVMVEDFLKKDN